MATLTNGQPRKPLTKDVTVAISSSSHKSVSRTKQRGKRNRIKENAERVFEQDSSVDHAKTGTSSWKFQTLTDSATSRHQPVFTKDGSYFFAIVGSTVRIHSSMTGLVVSTLWAASQDSSMSRLSAGTQQSDAIVAVALHPHNVYQLITGSAGGLICIWNFLDADLIQTIDTQQAITHIAVHKSFKDHIFIGARKSSEQETVNDANSVVLRVSLKPTLASASLKRQRSSEILKIGKTRPLSGLLVSASGNWLVAIAGHKAYVIKTLSLKTGFTKYVSPEKLTCLAVHPSDDHFATGDEKGNLRFWYCLDQDAAPAVFGVEKRAQTSTLHWHAHAVNAIAFTPNGAYLLSGGSESVLVVWQLHSGRKEFVPRVGSPIFNVAVSRASSHKEEEYLLGLSDASFVFISSATLKKSRAFSRIKLYSGFASSSPSNLIAPLGVHQPTSTIILPSSHPSFLQMYDPTTASLKAELEVSPSNRVSGREETPLEATRVDLVVLTPTGEWMATSDSRQGDDRFGSESHLKIWKWMSQTHTWVLNTRIDRPHGNNRLTLMAFSPVIHSQQSLQLVSVGNDGFVKSWRLLVLPRNNAPPEESWAPRSSLNCHSERPKHLSWSPDGSLLALTLMKYVALLNPSTNSTLERLNSPESGSIASSHFLGSSARYLVAAGVWDLVLWDLITRSVHWHHRTQSPIQMIVPHIQDESFAVLYNPSTSPITHHDTTPITILHPMSSKPLKTLTVPFAISNVVHRGISPVSSSFAPGSALFSLVGISRSHHVVLLGDEIGDVFSDGNAAHSIDASSKDSRRTLFQDIFGATAITYPLGTDFLNSESEKQSSGSTVIASNSREIIKLFDAPGHLMPGMDVLFDSVMDTFLQTRKQNNTDRSSPTPEDDDVAMEDQETASQNHQTTVDHSSLPEWGDTELNSFVQLFKSLQNTTDATPACSVNGSSTMSSRVNGKSPHSSSATISIHESEHAIKNPSVRDITI